MMQDYIRTSTYQKAILGNCEDFRNSVVLDVGAGSGILSFFAVQAGASKVYAVEASSMARHAEQLVHHNNLQDKIVVIPGKIEEIKLPEKVDIIISEPMGYMLFNERMLETYLHAKKWLQPNGKMFPSQGDLHIAPFSDAALYMEQLNKANFWYQDSFHGVDLSALRKAAVKEYFRQPVVDTFDIRICMAKSHRYTVDFRVASETDLHNIEIPFTFVMMHTSEIHGLAFWFDVAFFGSTQTVWLSTSPTQPLTHWYQVRCLVDTPLFAHAGQILTGHVILRSNRRQSYDVDIELKLENSPMRVTNSLDLKNPYFRYTGQAPQAPPGTYETSPTDIYWQSLESSNQGLMNGVNGSSNVISSNVPLVDMTGIPQNAPSGIANVPGGGVITPSNQVHLSSGSYQASAALGNMAVVNNVTNTMNNLPQVATYLPNTPLMNLGSVSSPGANNRSSPVSRTTMSSTIPPSSIGGGVSPSLFASSPSVSVLNTGFPVSSNLMIGDYVTPGNLVMAHQHVSFKPQ